MNILITGSSGLIGSYIKNELKKHDDFNVVVVNRTLIPDLADLDSITALNELGEIDIVVHCAAAIPAGQINAEKAARINKKIDNTIFEYIQQRNIKCIFISGMSVYADYGRDILIDESMPLLQRMDAKNAYFAMKIESEELFKKIKETVIFRVSSPYGQGQKNRTVFHIFAENCKQNKDIIYYGTGERTQDFIHGSDIARAVVCTIRQRATGVFNMVSGQPVSMRRLAHLFAETFSGYTGKVHSSQTPDPQEYFRACFSNTKAKTELGWTPTVSLKQGIAGLL